MAPRPRPTPEELARLYAELGSADALGRHLGCARRTALTWLRQAGVPIRPRGPHPHPSNHPWKRQNDRP